MNLPDRRIFLYFSSFDKTLFIYPKIVFHVDESKTIASGIIVTFISCIHISLVDRIKESINSKEKNNE